MRSKAESQNNQINLSHNYISLLLQYLQYTLGIPDKFSKHKKILLRRLH